jgi:hypothetical protein
MRLLPILALAAGCASNSFSKDDSGAVVQHLVTVSYSALHSAQPQATGTLPPVVSVDEAFACQGGGTSALAGGFSGDVDAAGTGSYSLDLMATFADCALGNGLVIAGAPYLATTGKLTFQTRELIRGSITYSGAFTANGDTCNIDVTLGFTSGAGVARATGSICGSAVDSSWH